MDGDASLSDIREEAWKLLCWAITGKLDGSGYRVDAQFALACCLNCYIR
jgi:hypothetical protein